MNKEPRFSFFGTLLRRTGPYYPVITLALAQVIVTPLGVALAALILSYNAGLSSEDLTRLALFTFSMVVIRNIFLLVGAHYANRSLVSRLRKWKRGETLERGSQEEIRAWRQATNIAWRYISIAFAALIVLVLPAVLFYAQRVIFATQDQQLYTSIAGITAGLGLAVLEVLLLERMMIPVREILVPLQFENQLVGFSSFRLLSKFIIVVFALILISALLIAPIGYHQTTRVLYEEIGSLKVLSDLQIQSVIATMFALLIGLGLSFLLASSISQPVGRMVDTFKKVEAGDLSQRVSITATDEVGELAVYFNRMVERLEELQSGLEKRVQERTEQLRSTIEVGQVASSILEPGELISRVVNLITERFGYYYAAIFLVDSSGRWAELKDATGAAGQALKSQSHRLEVGGKSMVSSAILKREAQIALDVGAEPTRFNNPLLPQTRSEIALPLMVGERVVGALDVQSTQEAAFDEETIRTLQGMANQVAIALENARLFQQIQFSLDELRAAHRLYVTEAWSKTAHENLHFEYEAGEESDSARKAGNQIEIPLTLREQPIGVLSMESGAEWTPEERNLLEAVATQAALALENARLLEESQQSALRERLAAEIISKIWASQNMDGILHTTVKEVGRALRADEATIEINIE
jgi:GAF domain-containing protein/HAMP domain-containing protein